MKGHFYVAAYNRAVRLLCLDYAYVGYSAPSEKGCGPHYYIILVITVMSAFSMAFNARDSMEKAFLRVIAAYTAIFVVFGLILMRSHSKLNKPPVPRSW